MSIRFNGDEGLVLTRVELRGPVGSTSLRMALDTGATRTTVNFARLLSIGYDPALNPDRVEVTTGSGIEFAPLVVVETLEALGRQRSRFHVLAHTLPPSTGVDGLLGLDFLRGQILTLDFRAGEMSLS